MLITAHSTHNMTLNFHLLINLKGAPIILSLPHMADAAPEYQTVKGLKPDLERGLTYVDIEPVSRNMVRSDECFILIP